LLDVFFVVVVVFFVFVVLLVVVVVCAFIPNAIRTTSVAWKKCLKVSPSIDLGRGW
jgi:hypothetical protein